MFNLVVDSGWLYLDLYFSTIEATFHYVHVLDKIAVIKKYYDITSITSMTNFV